MALENTFGNEKYRTFIFKMFSGLTIYCQRKHMVCLI